MSCSIQGVHGFRIHCFVCLCGSERALTTHSQNRQVATDSPARGTSRRRFSLKTPEVVTPIHRPWAFFNHRPSFSGITKLLSLKVWLLWPHRAQQSQPYPDTLPEPPLLAGQEETHTMESRCQEFKTWKVRETKSCCFGTVDFPEKTLDFLYKNITVW